MLLATAALDFPRLHREAVSWGANWDADVKHVDVWGDDIVTAKIVVTLIDGNEFVSIGKGDYGLGSEYVEFANSAGQTAQFFLNGL